MFSEEYLYLIALKQCRNIGNSNLRKLLKHSGSAKKVWESTPKALQSIYGIGKNIIRDIGKKEFLIAAEKEIKFCEKHDIKIVSHTEDSYPKHLLNCDDAPAILFYKGYLNPDHNPVGIVGTRKLTPYGKHFIQDFLSELINTNICTISGLALGADTCVHEESLKNEIPTIAILAQSLKTIYPSSNKNLAKRILDNNGALISEYTSFDNISRENFLQRNRIIAGFAPHLIVVETAYGGGSMTTVNYANGYDRDVFALPGKITDQYSQGCNQLIAMNKAETIVDIKTLIQNLNIAIQPELFPKEEPKVELDADKKEHLLILEIITVEKSLSLDEIADKTNILHHKLLPILLDLELYGYIKCLSGRQYQINDQK
ncbi:DNA-processing protein DprA [Epilithonimonas arachidiradicis]|uniref:DNA processing protein n=1 Tax=Epilithonimonas arachidiradicis TaxID=1617282 RepID=A0A420DE04_9FLAO|nr:DNA-processing protein DprA [Epilithonimonas arachidiradicis]RKE89857.1 DNA processing protein [Epilithonimonas arachidiradicis]GGG45844.1 DNA processing protein DprA [Epilithonimonas arachidiradicis]